MLRYHMAVVTPDAELKRAVRRLTTATGATAQFVASSAALHAGDRIVDLAIFDAREVQPSAKFLKAVPATARIMYIVSDCGSGNLLPLLEDHRVCSLFCYDNRFDDDEFICAATKALRSDTFGLQKYFPWGVTTYTMTIRNHRQKTKAIDIMMRFAKLAGVRGSVRDRIQLVVDELIMNALYHAPVDRQGNQLYAGLSPRELATREQLEPVQVQYGCSGQYFGVAVRDGGGSLTRKKTLEYLRRSNEETRIEEKASGAGLGLLSVMQSVSKLIFNLDQGYSTEVIGLFDMELFAKGSVGARSIHLHVEAPEPVASDQVSRAAMITRSQPISGAWLLAAVLSVIVVGLATTYYSRSQDPAVAQGPSITVVPSPADAEITLNDAPIERGARVELDPEVPAYEVLVTKEGYLPFSETLSADEVSSDLRVHVVLIPKRALVR